MFPFSKDIVLHRSHVTDSSFAALEWEAFEESINKKWDFLVPNLTVEMEKQLMIFNLSFLLDIYELKCFQPKFGGFELDGNIDSFTVTKYRVKLGATDLSLKCTSRWHYEMTGGGSGTGNMSTDISISSVSATYDLISDNFRTVRYPNESGLTFCAVDGKIENLSIDGTGLGKIAGLFESALEEKLTARMENEICRQAREIDDVAGPISIVFLLQNYFPEP
eukprot:CAMPEP_0194284342 /NCGR_PEP_ID=MMETSP0169-20130528/27391_1 /TAXON_ID=218684 /ORGANISM="Corethron pennatum, Strain L29A3" /LENGTH=220 /DNA_ID=CAMNT_0039030135 /DNA_START=272 /DNA_END=934 /DNA_ORIENTATION=+